MPTYEYECQECGHRFDQFQSMKDEPLKTCPTCGGLVRRLLGTGTALIIKGPSFHGTGYSRLGTRCGNERPCCGRDAPCDTPPCGD